MWSSIERRYTIRQADWGRDRDALRAVRETVFVAEQQVPPELEWDGEDEHALHVLAETGEGTPIGCARLIAGERGAHIGRMAVMRGWRGRGVGRTLLQALIARAQGAGLTQAWLNAQTTALPFYEKAGFRSVGAEFMDAGIPHVRMERAL